MVETTIWRDVFVWMRVGVSQKLEIPFVQDAEIQADDEDTNVRNLAADIMKESRSSLKRVASRSSFVKMSLGLMSPGMCRMSTSFA